MTYRPRGMPARFMRDAPAIVRREIIDIISVVPPMPFDFDVVLRPEPDPKEIAGVDFSREGYRGQHFFLTPQEARAYRERNRRKRVAWQDLPEATQRSILAYLETPP